MMSPPCVGALPKGKPYSEFPPGSAFSNGPPVAVSKMFGVVLVNTSFPP